MTIPWFMLSRVSNKVRRNTALRMCWRQDAIAQTARSGFVWQPTRLADNPSTRATAGCASQVSRTPSDAGPKCASANNDRARALSGGAAAATAARIRLMRLLGCVRVD